VARRTEPGRNNCCAQIHDDTAAVGSRPGDLANSNDAHPFELDSDHADHSNSDYFTCSEYFADTGRSGIWRCERRRVTDIARRAAVTRDCNSARCRRCTAHADRH